VVDPEVTVGSRHPEKPTPVERLAALLSLTAVAAAVVLLGVAVAANWEGILITAVGLLLIVVAGWYVVSRRGVARTVAVLTTVAGVGLIIAGFVVADLRPVTWV
jgi:dolichyl-phosphate-mannose--protein O-mannosyl transferase